MSALQNTISKHEAIQSSVENVRIHFWVIISILNPWYVNDPQTVISLTDTVLRCTFISLASRFTPCVSLWWRQPQIRRPRNKLSLYLSLSLSLSLCLSLSLSLSVSLSLSLSLWGPEGSEDSKSWAWQTAAAVLSLSRTLSVQSLSWSSDKRRGVGLL